MRGNQLFFIGICFLALLSAAQAQTYWPSTSQNIATTQNMGQPCPTYALPYCPDGKITTQIDSNGCMRPSCEPNSNNCPPTAIPSCLAGSELQKEIDANGCVRYSCKTPKACPAMAKICPDGTAVGPTGPNCEFVCPTEVQPHPQFCGDGICQRVACENIYCGEPETPENCPEDCLRTCPVDSPMPLCNGAIAKKIDEQGCPHYYCQETKVTCGNGMCETGEASECPACTKSNPPCLAPCKVGSCPQDCGVAPQPICGNGACDAGEAPFCPPCVGPQPCPMACSRGTCPQDCGQTSEKKECKSVFSSCSCSYHCAEIDPNHPMMDCARACMDKEMNQYKPNCDYINGVCQDIEANHKCGNGICEEGEANDAGGCGPNADPRCLGPPARQGTCPQDCMKNSECPPPTKPECPEGNQFNREWDEHCQRFRYTCVPKEVCDTHYEPVCGLVRVQCIRAPCPPVYQTFSNKCELKRNSLAEFSHEGPCETSTTCSKPQCPGAYATGEYNENCPVYKCPENTQQPCNGCRTDDNCLPYGTRTLQEGKPTYCDISKGFLPQQQKGESCQNNYECASNQCSEGKCINLEEQLKETQGMLEKVLGWLGKLFG